MKDAAIDLPVPPLCAESAETIVRRGERVVVELIGGRRLIGKLARFDAEKGSIAVTPEGADKHKALGMHEIRLMRVPQPRKWVRDDEAFLSEIKGVRVVSEPLEFDIEFSDQSSINGITFGFRNGRHGMHLFPVQDHDQYTHLFVPNNAIARHRIGKHLAHEAAKETKHRDMAMIRLEQPERTRVAADTPSVSAQHHAVPPRSEGADKPLPLAIRPTAQCAADVEHTAFLRALIVEAAETQASTVHFTSTAQHGARVHLRRQGELIAHGVISAEQWPGTLAQLKSWCRIEETTKAVCSGRLDPAVLPAAMSGHGHFVATADGEDVVVRFAAREPVPSLGDMGLGASYVKRLDELGLGGGLLLLAGAENERLLHAVLLHLHQGEKKIWALGDVTMANEAMAIRRVRDSGDGADTLASLLDADADVIAIHRLCDAAIGRRATAAALDGTPIIASLAAHSAAAAVERCVNMGVPRHELADALTAVLFQRHAKRLCPHCKKRYAATADELRLLLHEYHGDTPADDIPADVIMQREKTLRAWHAKWAEEGQLFLYRKAGCAHCQKTGYAGHLALHELLEWSTPVRKALLDGADAQGLAQAAVGAGMKTLRQDGIEKALQGHLDLIQVRAVCAR